MKYVRFCVTMSLLIAATAASASPLTAIKFASKPDNWFATPEGVATIDNIISWQRPEGGWTKDYDASRPHSSGEGFESSAGPTSGPIPKNDLVGWDISTIDNNATYSEIRLLSRAYTLTHRENARDSVNRALDWLFASQYPNGGWPQRFPLPRNYGRDITFNDNAMTAVLFTLRDVADGGGSYAFIDAERRSKARAAFDRGLECVLKLQITSPGTGKLTVWAQQYDPQTLQPVNARTFELAGLAAGESAAIMKLLMSIDKPSPEVQRAVRAGAAWFDAAKITGKRLERENGNVVIIDDPSAEPIWARFYEIETNRPFFCGRDGVKKYSLAEIERERRNGYAWYRTWGKTVAAEYEEWSRRHPGATG
jgi:PelA/Pel-15E family pectate lyase